MNLIRTTLAIVEPLNTDTELDQMVECLTFALALHDSETEEHTRRVTTMVLNLARAADVPEVELIHIRRGVMLHDIGKIGIPDFILRKCAPLSRAEWDIIRLYPVYAYELLSRVPSLNLRSGYSVLSPRKMRWSGLSAWIEEGANSVRSTLVFHRGCLGCPSF